MKIHVHKCGGASLANAGAIAHAVLILKGQPGPVVVVSAMAGVTDALLNAARKAAEEAAAKAQLKDAIPPDLSNTRSATAETVERKSPVFNQLFDN